jgi:2-dehydro-3-deoxygalactonokinase
VPHVLAPTGLDELARHVVTVPMPEIAPQPIYLIPGVKTMTRADNPLRPTPYGKQRRSHGAWDSLAEIDILRGEESEMFGILAATGRHGPLCLLLPGSHTKLVRIDAADRITGSFTTIAGEVMQAIAEHTILAHSIDWPPQGEPEWPTVLAGADFARYEGLLRAGFAVRLADVVLQLDRTARTWFFVGMIVGTDITELIGEFARSPQFSHAVPLVIGGRQPLRSAYGMLIRDLGFGSVEVLDDAIVEFASARGAIAIASAAIR